MSEPLTKQGVRNLDGTKQKNGRRRNNSDACFHEWVHDRDCPCRDLTYDDFRGSCWETCRKCGQPRGR